MNPLENYLQDAFTELLARARSAKADYAAVQRSRGEAAAPFEAGRALAYYEVTSLLVNQLDAFGIDRQRVGLSPEFDVEHELP